VPWSPKTFGARHNHKLKGPALKKAEEMATAMVREGVPEGIAIATANKRGDRMMRKKHRSRLYYHPRSRAES